MTDLASWLLAQIADDEAAAREWDSDGRARIAVVWTGADPGYTTAAIDHADDVWVADGREVVDPRNVTVMYDPARVLAECAAKRRVLDLRDSWSREVERAPSQVRHIFETQVSAADAIIEALAQPYADRPGSMI